jgi:hypothetical protein
VRALVLAAVLVLAAAHDADYKAALDDLYDGSSGNALARLGALRKEAPADPLAPYFEALALAWGVEQRPDDAAQEALFQRRVEETVALATAQLEADPTNARARLARGGAWGVLSRWHMFKSHRTDAARAAVKAREDLQQIPAGAFGAEDALFGLGLYDYYADVLPRMIKILRFLARMPAGNRERGLARIEQASRTATFHRSEALSQLYDIYAFYEKKPDRALVYVSALRARYPGSPLWALKLAEHERDRLGLYAESARVAREILAALEHGRPNYAGPELQALARLSLAESLIADGHPEDALREVAGASAVAGRLPWVGPRVVLVEARARALEGDVTGAAARYAAAAASQDPVVRARAETALAHPLDAREIAALRVLWEARRLRQQGHTAEAAPRYRVAHGAWPALAEAAVGAAEADMSAATAEDDALRHDLQAAQKGDPESESPPWVAPWATLVLARRDETLGDRAAALRGFRAVAEAPCGQAWLKRDAAEGVARLGAAAVPRPSPSASPRTIPKRRKGSPPPTP